MKRLLSLLLSFSLLVSVSACSAEQTPPEQPDSPPAQSQPESPSVPVAPPETPPELPAEDTALSPLSVLLGQEGRSEWSDGVPLCSSSWQVLALGAEDEARYPALADSLRKINQESAAWGERFMEDNLPYARELLAENGEYFYGLTCSDAYTVQRADEVILSIRGKQSDYTGGVHPNYGVYGLNLDPETGARVELTDVLTTTDGLADMLTEKILAKYPGEPFSALSETLAEYAPEHYSWTVNDQGLTFYFSPYEIASYAAGLLTATIWFDEAPELFREEYLKLPESGYAVALPTSSPVEFDLDASDGVRDVITVSFLAGEDETRRPMLSVNDSQLYDEEYYCYEMYPYLVHTAGKNYIYLEGMSENDYRTLSVYDLNDDEIRLVGRVEASGFHSVWHEEDGTWGTSYTEVFTTPGHFVLDTRLDMLGTMTGTKTYHVNEESGMPEAESPFYTLPEEHPPLTTLVPVEVELLPGGQRETLPAGTQLWFLRTDGAHYVDMKPADSRECRIAVETGPEGWERYINGVPEWDCFEGLLYAG